MNFGREMFKVLAALSFCALLTACGGSERSDPPTKGSSGSAGPQKTTLATPVAGDFAANGWYWNPTEGGTGFMFEAQGNRAFVAFFMYEDGTGKPTWYAAYGDFTAGAAVGAFSFAGDLRVYRGGQAVSSATYTGPSSTSVGTVSIAFTGNRAQVQLPGGRTIDGQRYVIDGSGFDFSNPVATKQNQPEVGWYWNPAEGGRGYAIEVQNNKVFMAMFHYNPDGTPTWNVVQGDVSTGATVQPFELYSGGQTLTSAYRGPTQIKLSPFTLGFRNACAGQMQYSGAPAITVRRFRIDGTDLSPGAECNAVGKNTFPLTPGLRAGGAVMEPGDSVFGRVNANGEVYTHAFNLQAGSTYTFTVEGVASGAGTLTNPALAVHDANLVSLQVIRQSPSRVNFTPATSGIYHVVVQADPAGTGSFLLTSSGTASGISAQPAPPLGSYAGNVSGSFNGNTTGNVALVVDATGKITGGVVQSQSPGVTLVVAGTVAVGGAVDFTATGPGASVSFKGFLSPQGNLSGAWSGANGSGGMFFGARTVTTPPPPQGQSCYDGNMANAVGADDPFFVNAWHLKNTGPTQVVSATQNTAALAGIDANVENVHKGGRGCTGKGITVAIVDTALELGHEDLAPNVLAGKSFNFVDNSSDPSPALGSAKLDHGTGVAGAALARGWNGSGSRGTAPFASVVGYNIVSSQILDDEGDALSANSNASYLSFGARPLADDTIPASLSFGDRANDVSIFNFSAGIGYLMPSSINTDPLSRPPTHQAFEYGTTNLRGGLGAVYFQSAGNAFISQSAPIVPGGPSERRVCKAFRDDYAFGTFQGADALTCGSNNHEPNNKPFAYPVAAIHNTGRAASYSSAGASVWITGFAGEFGDRNAAIISTDNSGCQSGANNLANKPGLVARFGDLINLLIANLFGDSAIDPNCNYTGTMNGTSAAAPSMSGVAALMLEANPRLTWRDVGFILAKTARKVDTGIASGDRTVIFQANGSPTAVLLDDPWLTNAAGFNFQSRYGFGLVDADAAVRLAANYAAPAGRRATALTVQGGSSSEVATEASNGLKNYRATAVFPDATAVSGPVRVDFAFTNTGDLPVNPGLLQFEIVNKATGTKSILLPAFTSWYVGGEENKIGKNGLRTYRFHTNAFYGESLNGGFDVTVRSFVPTPAGSPAHSLRFEPTVTSFSM